MIQLHSRLMALVTAAFIVPASVVLACEGECIVGITNALLGNYTTPMNRALTEIESAINSEILGRTGPESAQSTSLFGPLLDEYGKLDYDYMEKAVFKSYFHGKCEDPTTGIDPPGCPNPDCPVRCGTPGSIIHFYSKFCSLAFDAIIHLFDEIIKPSSAAYQKFEQGIVSARSSSSSAGSRQRVVRFMREADWVGKPRAGLYKGKNIENRAEDIRDRLQKILQQFPSKMKSACGDDLRSCSWEPEFKQYILSFP